MCSFRRRSSGRVVLDASSLYYLFFNDTATTEIYTLSLHDALPILMTAGVGPTRPFALMHPAAAFESKTWATENFARVAEQLRSEEHTSELQSRQYLVCRLLLEKKNTPRHLRLRLPAHTSRHNLYQC